jgi:predicted nucleic acid-binding protein
MIEQGRVFLDTSALLKRYVIEQGSHHVTQFFTPYRRQSRIFVSELTYVEALAAFARRSPAPPAATSKAFMADYQRGMRKVFIDRAIIEQAALLAQTHRLRSADAIQLASVLRVVESVPDILLLTADLEMIVAAQIEGLQVENPNRYD